MRYLLKRNGWYIYSRRIPQFLRNFDRRRRITLALNTQCRNTASDRLVILNKEVEDYWKALVEAKQTHCEVKFKQLGFIYRSTNDLLDSGKLEEILNRVLTVKKFGYDKNITPALLGVEEKQTIQLSGALEKFWEYSKPTLIKKNPDQQRKWKNARRKAVNNFIKVVGDLNILEITNRDLVKFRDWWVVKIEKADMKNNSANKDFSCLRTIIDTVSTHEQLDIDVQKLFKKIRLKNYSEETRNSYTPEFIKQEILKPKNIDLLDKEIKSLLYVCIETGARPIEIVNLVADDIFLDEPVPYIYIRPRKGYSLKTRESKRKLPLVGQALNVFKDYPNGFVKYFTKSNMFSDHLNSFLSENNLRPTQKHSLYSFRHSFQDRLTALELPDRIQCQLMGHKFRRPKYGSGSSLEHLQAIMQKVSLTS